MEGGRISRLDHLLILCATHTQDPETARQTLKMKRNGSRGPWQNISDWVGVDWEYWLNSDHRKNTSLFLQPNGKHNTLHDTVWYILNSLQWDISCFYSVVNIMLFGTKSSEAVLEISYLCWVEQQLLGSRGVALKELLSLNPCKMYSLLIYYWKINSVYT